MGGHHHEAYKVPDPSIYKVEDAPKLKQVQEALGRQGLRDPWLRNEVWRYDVKQHGTHRARLLYCLFRGLPLAVVACAATIGLEFALKGEDDGHGHGHGDH